MCIEISARFTKHGVHMHVVVWAQREAGAPLEEGGVGALNDEEEGHARERGEVGRGEEARSGRRRCRRADGRRDAERDARKGLRVRDTYDQPCHTHEHGRRGRFAASVSTH